MGSIGICDRAGAPDSHLQLHGVRLMQFMCARAQYVSCMFVVASTGTGVVYVSLCVCVCVSPCVDYGCVVCMRVNRMPRTHSTNGFRGLHRCGRHAMR